MCCIHLTTEDHTPLKSMLRFIPGSYLSDSGMWGRGSSKGTKMSNGTVFTVKYVQCSHPALLGMSHRCKDKCVGGEELQRILLGRSMPGKEGRERGLGH